MKDLGRLLKYATKNLAKITRKGIYMVLLLFYAYKNKSTPAWAKRIIIGSLAYFLSPIDAIPDLAPVIGMTDDLGVLSFGIAAIACYINEDVRFKAKEKLSKLFPDEAGSDEIRQVDKML